MATEKRPTDHLEPSAKKRTSERQITKDDTENSDEEVCSIDLRCWKGLCGLRKSLFVNGFD